MKQMQHNSDLFQRENYSELINKKFNEPDDIY